MKQKQKQKMAMAQDQRMHAQRREVCSVPLASVRTTSRRSA